MSSWTRGPRPGGGGSGDDDAPSSRRQPPPTSTSTSMSSSSPVLLPSSPRLVPPTQTSPWYVTSSHHSSAPSSSSSRQQNNPPLPQRQRRRSHRQSLSSPSSPRFLPSTMPSYGSSSRLGGMRRMRREHESGGGGGTVDGRGDRRGDDDAGASDRRRRSASVSGGGGGGGRSSSLVFDLENDNPPPSPSRPLFLSGRVRSNPFLRKPIGLSSESLPLLLRQGSSEHSRFGSALSMQTSTAGSSFSIASEYGAWGGGKGSSPDAATGANTTTSPTPLPAQQRPPLHAPPVSTHGHVERHLGLFDLVAVGVGGTLGTGFFLLCGLLTSTYAGPSSALCWILSAVPALLSGFCFAELAGQIPAAGTRRCTRAWKSCRRCWRRDV